MAPINGQKLGATVARNRLKAKVSKLLVNTGLVLSVIASGLLLQQANAADTEKSRVYSPDHKVFAFVKTMKETVPTGAGDVQASEIWLGDSASGKSQPLFKSGTKVATGQQIGDIAIGDASDLSFSLNGEKLYFLCGAYAVSGAVIETDLKTKKLRYVSDGNSVSVIPTGKWKGNLAVSRHKYHKEGGAYDWEWVVNSAGKELGLWKKLD